MMTSRCKIIELLPSDYWPTIHSRNAKKWHGLNRAATLLNLDGNTQRASIRDVTQYRTLSAIRSGELKQIYKTNGPNFDCAQASQTRAHGVHHPSTPAAWQYMETQGLGKHNQRRPEPLALELNAKNQTHFALSTKKIKRPPVQVYFTIDKEHSTKHYIK